MKTAGQTLADMMRSNPAAISLVDVTCADCGRPIKVQIPVDGFQAAPGLECLGIILVCNGCGDFRHALRSVVTQLESLERIARGKIDSIIANSSGDGVEQGVAEFRSATRLTVEAAFERLIRILSFRSGRPKVMPDPFVSAFLNLVEKNAGYAGEVHHRLVSANRTRDCVGGLMSHYRLVTMNHWRNPKRNPAARPGGTPAIEPP